MKVDECVKGEVMVERQFGLEVPSASDLPGRELDEVEAETARLRGMLDGVRVLESGGVSAELCGQLLAGLGADVLKVEVGEGSHSRTIGPMWRNGERVESLFHLTYNRGKGSLWIGEDIPEDLGTLQEIVSVADVWLDGATQGSEAFLGCPIEELAKVNPRLVVARMSPFGDTGPWADYVGSDLVHLALGGVVMNCGYDPGLDGKYDTPPIWPQAFHSLHVAGEQLAMAIVAALYWRLHSGRGQVLRLAMHEAVSKCTEIDLMSWAMLRAPTYRRTCRHAGRGMSPPTIAQTKDGRWMTAMSLSGIDRLRLREFLGDRGFGVVSNEEGSVAAARFVPGNEPRDLEEGYRDIELVQRLVGRALYRDVPWEDAQAAGLLWAPLRKPHESAGDSHWLSRGTFADLDQGDGRKLRLPVSKWRSTGSAWSAGGRAPDLGDDMGMVTRWRVGRPAERGAEAEGRGSGESGIASRQWALEGVRIVDFSWFLASAGGTRFLSAMGAECIKVEWWEHPDTRLGAGAPLGGRAERERANEPLEPTRDPDMGGNFNHKNAGKRGISLNIGHPKGLEIARELIRRSDVVAEGFRPGVLERWGLGYDELKSLQPKIVYAQMSGMGAVGKYAELRAVGPIAAAFAGISEMSGHPEPAPPAGWGYSYLDWLAAYSFATAIIGGLYQKEVTGEGQHIDVSQCEVGIYTSGLAIADWSGNGNVWHRTGNRSPFKVVAPEGVYPCAGEDRWIALSCESDSQWRALVGLVGSAELEQLAALGAEERAGCREKIDGIVGRWTRVQERYELMDLLQNRGIPAGVCQTAEDRFERDPQLTELGWMTEVTGSKIGTWPVGEVAVKMDATPPYIGGKMGRGAPCYGEDNYLVYGELLGLSEGEVDGLREEGAI